MPGELPKHAVRPLDTQDVLHFARLSDQVCFAKEIVARAQVACILQVYVLNKRAHTSTLHGQWRGMSVTHSQEIRDDDPLIHNLPSGYVGRRAPANPLNSPMLARLRGGKKKNRAKVKDPKLNNNPLRGRLVVCISTTALLFWIFMWE